MPNVDATVDALGDPLTRPEKRFPENAMLTPNRHPVLTPRTAAGAETTTSAPESSGRALLLQSDSVKLSVLDALAAHIAVIDLDGLITEVNEPWRQFAVNNGLQHDVPASATGVGTNYLAVCAAAGNPSGAMSPAYEGIQAVLQGGAQRFSLEYPCHSPTEERWFEMCVMPVGQPVPTGAVIAHTNISEHKRLSDALNSKNAELEQARAAADKANRAKSAFLSGMSHELRTPLGAILGFAQLIESGTPQPTDSQKRSVEQILQAGWYQLELIDEILDLALVESGKLSLTMEAVSLAEVLGECEAMVEAQAAKRGIALAFVHAPASTLLQADRVRLKQVLTNLLSNAIKYNRPGGSVVVRCLPASRGSLRVSVTDTGHGLSPLEIGQLFQPFNRLGQEAGTEQGTGIGLLMTKRLVETMGGAIGVESTPGQGSVFWVDVLLAASGTPLPLASSAGVPDAASPQGVTPARTVLYVEDNAANLLLVEQLLARRPDLQLHAARDGHAGLAMARALLPDVILMDIHLPGLTGLQVLELLQQDSATAHIPVLALSASAMPRDIQTARDAGVFNYLTKPIRIHPFMAALDDALAFSQTTADSRFGSAPPEVF